MDRLTVISRCGGAELYFLCPVTLVIKRLYRV